MADTGLYKVSFGPPPELNEMFADYAKRTDVGEALITAAGVENWLEHLLLMHMRPLSNTKAEDLFSGHGPLASFYSKIIVAHAFKLIDDETRSTLLIIKEVRNEFAHSKERIHFDSPEIAKICDKLRDGKVGSENKLLFQNKAQVCVSRIKSKIDIQLYVQALTDPDAEAGTTNSATPSPKSPSRS